MEGHYRGSNITVGFMTFSVFILSKFDGVDSIISCTHVDLTRLASYLKGWRNYWSEPFYCMYLGLSDKILTHHPRLKKKYK